VYPSFNGNVDISGTLLVGSETTVKTTLVGGLNLIVDNDSTNAASYSNLRLTAGSGSTLYVFNTGDGTISGQGWGATAAVGQGIYFPETFVVVRSGVELVRLLSDEVELNAGTLDFNGNADISGTLDVGGHVTISGASGTHLRISKDDDGFTGGGSWLIVTKTGGNTLADEIELNATTLDFNGNADISGTLVVGSTVDATHYTADGATGGKYGWDNDSDTFIFRSVANRISVSTGGVVAFEADDNATAGNTKVLVWDVDNGGLERVSVGVADSGGAGFKLLRIPN
jgi:hypothetical protein